MSCYGRHLRDIEHEASARQFMEDNEALREMTQDFRRGGGEDQTAVLKVVGYVAIDEAARPDRTDLGRWQGDTRGRSQDGSRRSNQTRVDREGVGGKADQGAARGWIGVAVNVVSASIRHGEGQALGPYELDGILAGGHIEAIVSIRVRAGSTDQAAVLVVEIDAQTTDPL